MLISRNGFHAFSDYDLGANLEKFLADLRKGIDSDPQIGTKDEEEYVQQTLAQRKLEPLALDTENITVTQKEVEIPGRYFPRSFDVDSYESYPKPVITFHLPFSGNPDFLRCRPSTFMMASEDIAVENNEILFEIINLSNDADAVKRDRDQALKRLTEMVGYVNNDINAYNSKLEGVIRSAIQGAKAKFKAQGDFLDSLGNKPKQ